MQTFHDLCLLLLQFAATTVKENYLPTPLHNIVAGWGKLALLGLTWVAHLTPEKSCETFRHLSTHDYIWAGK